MIIIKLMCKRSFITLKKNRRLYKICSEDIIGIYKASKKKTPKLPEFDVATTDEREEERGNSNLFKQKTVQF